MTTRTPLWDDHDEEHDPDNRRVLDQGRLTFSTTWLDAVPVALAKMPSDTLSPLVAALALTALFFALLVKALVIAGGIAALTAMVAAVWLWPKEENRPRTPPDDSEEAHRPHVTAIDTARGSMSMWLLIATEAMLFVLLFFTYFALGPYPTEDPPKLHYALPMLGILLASSVVIHWGERRVKKEQIGKGRAALVVTLLLGVVFLTLQVLEYGEHLKTLTPQSSAYGSIFYTLTSFHALHVVVGMLMLGYALVLPQVGPALKPPHRAFTNVSRYWHFVDVVWVLVVAIVYVAPHFGLQ